MFTQKQIAGKFYTFPCGCSGILPEKRGQTNMFASWAKRKRKRYWTCRVQGILQSGACQARKYGYTSIDPKTPHSIIRKMMAETLCERCGKGLDWTVCVKGKTPHLHHSHDTGEIHGFTHVQCNPQALKNEIDNLRTENARLQTEIERLEYDLQDAYDTI